MSKPNKARGGASRQRAAAPKPKSLPTWVWLFSGIAIGLFIALLSSLAPNTVDVREAAGTAAPSTDTKPSKPRAVFDFYTVLPENRVELPSNTSVKTRNTPKPKPTASSRLEGYLLQAGSFRSAKDADRLKAQLTLLGLDVQTKKVTIRGNETWYRVQVGPFGAQKEVEQARQTLATVNINPLPLKLK